MTRGRSACRRNLPLLGLGVGLAMHFAAVGCRPPAPGFVLEEAARGGAYEVGTRPAAGLRFAHPPRLEEVTVDHQRRTAAVLPAGRWSWTGRIPPAARLFVGAAALGEEKALPGSFAVSVDTGDGPQVVADVQRPRSGRRWADFEADLAAWAGREATVEFFAVIDQEPPPEIAWGPVVLRSDRELGSAAASGEERRRPNILLISVDTLRHDHLSCYGHGRPTSPNIDGLLARRGVVLEDAYAQAPWTLPSVVSMLTGRYPTELLPDEEAAYRIPEEVPSLSELLRGLGYETAAFYANPALHAGSGFGRGFDTFFAPPASFDWFERHADDLNARLLPWVRANRHRPFFLYAHYLDPHDPYDNPDVVDGNTPFDPDYTGSVTGKQVHRIYGGFDPLPDPERDVHHLAALYDSEIAYVDRHVGELLQAFGPQVLEDTLVIFTSDHGEELYDHGGFKHGQSLYEEQIHVPLVVRWDRRLPAGRRLAGTVELLDVLPTVMAAAGAEPDPEWQGRNLLPSLAGEEPLPRRSAFFQHLAAGPLRAGAVLDGFKLILFNRHEPFAPPDAFQDYLWRKDLARFEDLELYDLAADPQEKENLASSSPQLAARLAEIVHRRLDRRLPGLRIVLDELPAGRKLVARFGFDPAPDGWDPYFLGADDRVVLEGTQLHLELAGGLGRVPGRGVLVRGDIAAVEVEELTLDGEALPPSALRVGDGAPAASGRLSRATLQARRWPPPEERLGLRLWLPSEVADLGSGERDEETVRRLKALGYLLQ